MHAIARFRLRSLLLAYLPLSFFLCVNPLFADPSDKEPDKMLDLHNESISGETYRTAVDHYNQATKLLNRLGQLQAKNRLAGAKPKEFTSLFAACGYLQDQARKLQASGEPAGVDLLLRHEQLFASYSALLNTYRTLEPAARHIQSIRNGMGRSLQTLEREAKAVQLLIAAQNWKEAHPRVLRMELETFADVIFLAPVESSKITDPILSLRTRVDPPMDRQRRVEAYQKLGKLRDSLLPNYAAQQARMAAAQKSLAETGVYQVDGRMLSGPETITFFHRQWQDVRLRVVKARSVEWACISIALDGKTQRHAAIDAKYLEYVGGMPASLAKLITSHASKVDSPSVKKTYLEYMQVLAPVVLELEASSLEPLDEALAQLAAKDDGLVSEIEDYRIATDELLRWKRRAAARTAARRRQENFASLETRFREATKSRQGFRGLAPGPESQSAALTGPAPTIVRAAAKAMIGQPVRLGAIAPLANDAPKALSRYRMRTYALLAPFKEPLAGKRAELTRDLLAGEAAPPLSLKATAALLSTEKVRLDQLGGVVAGLHLEAAITRFANLPPAASTLTQLDVLPAEPVARGAGIAEMLMRFDIAPRWLGHRYFVVDLPE